MHDPSALPRRLAADSWFGAGHGVAVLPQVVDTTVTLHWHEFFELSFVTAGTGRHAVNGAPQPLRAGDVLALTPADFHELAPDAGQSLYLTNIIYTDEVLPAALLAELRPTPMVHLPELASDFERMIADSHRPGPISALALRATLIRIAADVVAAMPACGNDRSPQRAIRAEVQRAITWIDHHFRQPIRLADAAAVANLSHHHFSGVFRQATGMSFQDYLMSRRLHFARNLLAASNLPVTQVCHAAGFNDLTHFGRSYRRRYGHPPSHETLTSARPHAAHASAEPGSAERILAFGHDG